MIAAVECESKKVTMTVPDNILDFDYAKNMIRPLLLVSELTTSVLCSDMSKNMILVNNCISKCYDCMI